MTTQETTKEGLKMKLKMIESSIDAEENGSVRHVILCQIRDKVIEELEAKG